jgi:DNA-binding NarL/FixJ family response regulator
MKKLRVILADDHALVRAGIRALMENLPDVEVVGEAGDGTEALEAHRAQMTERLGIHDVPGLVRYAMRIGLLRPEPPRND